MASNTILVAWIGNTDLRCAGCKNKKWDDVDIGPIARALGRRGYSSICLLNDVKSGEPEEEDKKKGKCYSDWLDQDRMGVPDHKVIDVVIQGATHMDSIYKQARYVLDSEVSRHANRPSMVFLLSSGTPAMGSVWVLLASRYGAKLVESSRERGVLDVVVPMPDYETVLMPGLRQRGYGNRKNGGASSAQILLTWLGDRDRRAPDSEGPGPVAGYLGQRFCLHKHHYRKVFVLYEENDSARDASRGYCQWLQDLLGDKTTVISHPVHLAEKTLQAIHAATQEVVWWLRAEEEDPALDFLVSPGLSHMQIAWMLVWTGYPEAVLWETWQDRRTKQEKIATVALPLLD